MSEQIKAKEPFRFHTRFHLSELTGFKAFNLEQLAELIEKASLSSIYHHTHRFLQQHQYLSPEPPNDFAYWVTEVLGENKLGEKLASIDTIQFLTLGSLRDKLLQTIRKFLEINPKVKLRFAAEGEEFHFIKSISFVLPTNYAAYDLDEFKDILHKITIDSIYFHIFESRLRLEKKTNDFSLWIETSLGNKNLAEKLNRLDPYTYTLEDLRKTLIKIIDKNKFQLCLR